MKQSQKGLNQLYKNLYPQKQRKLKKQYTQSQKKQHQEYLQRQREMQRQFQRKQQQIQNKMRRNDYQNNKKQGKNSRVMRNRQKRQNKNIKFQVIDGNKLPNVFQLEDYQTQISRKVKRFIEQNQGQNNQIQKKQLLKQLRLKFFSQQNILKQSQDIALNIFYFPTSQLALQLQQIALNKISYQDVLFQSLVFKKGDLFNVTQNKQQAQHVMKWVRNWGKYYFDLYKLQNFAFKKSGNSSHRIYQIPEYQMIVHVIGQQIVVQYQNKKVSPSQFSQILNKIALQRLQNQVAELYTKFLKKTL